jgi:hypothetical protein
LRTLVALRYNLELMASLRCGAPAKPSARYWLIAVLLAGFALRLHELTRQDIWWDEARNLDVALRPFLQVATAPELDIHPPVYFWALHAWARLGDLAPGMDPVVMAFFGRFLSVAAGIAGVALVYVLAAMAAGTIAGLLSSAIGSLAPFWFAESQETRMYTFGFALLLAAAVCFWLAEAEPDRSRARRRRRAAFVLFSALALLSHYNTMFVVLAWYVWWVVYAWRADNRRSAYLAWLTSGLATALLVLPAAPIAARQIPGYANPNLGVPTIAEYLWQNWQAYIGGYAYSATWLGGRAGLWLAVVALAGLGGAVLMTVLRRRKADVLGFLWVWLLAPLLLYYLAVLDRGAFNVRYSSFVTPALVALLGAGLAVWGRVWRPLPVVALLGLMIAWPAALWADVRDPRFAREDIAGVTHWLKERLEPGDVVFVDQKYPFGFYFQRYAVDPNTEPVGAEAASARYLFVDINTLDQRLNAWARDARRVFWVQWFESDTDPRRAVPFLLDQAGKRGGEEAFQGYSIDWWELEPPNEFALASAEAMTPQQLEFAPAVRTVEVQAPSVTLAPGDAIPVVIRWQRAPNGEVTRPLKARVALYDAGGARLDQRDERLLNDRHLLPQEWSDADQPLNVYLLHVPEEAAPGDYTLGLLVYDADSLEPLGVVDQAGNPAGVEAMFWNLEVGPHAP